MTIFFTAALEGKKEYQKYFDFIVKVFQSNNVKVISREIQQYESILSTKDLKGLRKDEIHYKFVKKGISLANAVVIEASVNKFQLGHEATLALLYNKPVICISRTKDYSIQIQHPKFYSFKYENEKDLEVILKKFIEEYGKKYLSVRFNAFISPEQKTFLDWFSDRQKKNASTIVRELIDKKIKETPEFYDNF